MPLKHYLISCTDVHRSDIKIDFTVPSATSFVRKLLQSVSPHMTYAELQLLANEFCIEAMDTSGNSVSEKWQPDRVYMCTGISLGPVPLVVALKFNFYCKEITEVEHFDDDGDLFLVEVYLTEPIPMSERKGFQERSLQI